MAMGDTPNNPVNVVGPSGGAAISGPLGRAADAASVSVALSTEDVAALALLAPSTAAGAAITPVVTSALATSKVIKASPGNLYGLNCMATTVAGIFLVHNATTAPSAGAVTPIKAYPVGVGQGLEVSYNPPLRLGTGISITFTSAATPFTQTDSATAFIEGDAV